MTDPRAIAAVTRSLRMVIQQRMNADSADFNAVQVLARAPDRILADDAELETHKLNLFLYRVAPNAALANADLPTRRGDGSNANQPILALDLFYLLTAYGLAHDEEDAQHLLAHAMSVVSDNGVLGREQIATALTGTAWASSGLADQIEQISMSPSQLDDESLFRMWSSFGGSYRISQGYVATAVLIARARAAHAAPPVRSTQVVAAPLDRPVIERLDPQPVTAGAAVTISGRNLASDEVVVRLGSGDVAIPAGQVTPSSIALNLPGDLRAGPNGMQVLHSKRLPDNGETRLFATSQGHTFMLAPRLVGPVPTTVEQLQPLTLSVAPQVARRQRVLCLLGSRAVARDAPADAAELHASATFAIPATIPVGSHSLRVSVDGAESALTADPNGDLIEPQIQVTAP